MRIAFLLALLLYVWPGRAPAEIAATCKGYIDSVPTVITQGGTWCLDHDVATAVATGAAITVQANNVVIDCNGFKIGGLGAGPATETDGIVSVNRSNTVVRNCNVRGFQIGIGFSGGSGYVVERNRVESNTLGGIVLSGSGSVIRDNLVIDTAGGGTSVVGIFTVGIVDVLDNTVSGVSPSGTGIDTFARGIYLTGNTGSLVERNIVRGLATSGGIGTAIYVASSANRLVIRNNELMGRTSEEVAYGVFCQAGESLTILYGNSLLNFPTPWAGCTDRGDNVELMP